MNFRDETRKTNVWFEAQYEKLAIFCFSCSLMGHSEIDCPNPAPRGSDGKLPYDVRLRAPFEKRTKFQSFSQAADAMFASSSVPLGAGNLSKHRDVGGSCTPERDVTQSNSQSCTAKEEERKGVAADNCSLDVEIQQQQKKRKPSASDGFSLDGTPASNLPPRDSTAIIPAGFDFSLRNMASAARASVEKRGGVEETENIHKLCKIGGGCQGAVPPSTMSLLCLNCRGCGRPEEVREIRNLVDLYRPKVLFLSETRMSATRVKEPRWRLGFLNIMLSVLTVWASVVVWDFFGRMIWMWI
jgi:hypothetical protein